MQAMWCTVFFRVKVSMIKIQISSDILLQYNTNVYSIQQGDWWERVFDDIVCIDIFSQQVVQVIVHYFGIGIGNLNENLRSVQELR